MVLAAGKGARMRSRIPKPLHLLSGRPLVSYAVEAVAEAAGTPPIVVRAPDTDFSAFLGPEVRYAVQETPTGTGGALFPVEALAGRATKHLLVVNGDTPFVSVETLRRLMREHEETNAAMTFLASAAVMQEGLGRVRRGIDGRVQAIVEAREAEGAGASYEANCGAYCFDAAWLWEQFPRLRRHGDEIYLTDLAGIASADGQTVHTTPAANVWESFGINTRVHLAQAEARLREITLERLMLGGVTLMDPATTYIDASVSVGEDTVIYPNTHIRGRTAIGRDCRIGPGAQVRDSRIGDGCTINAAVIEESTVEEHVDIGPYCHLRPGAYLCTGVHMGNFGEVKNSRLGRNTQMGHFSYIGDAEIGANVNIAAGVITCNYDGVTKHKTIVEDDAFIGCDTMLVAPVRVGARSATGAGAVVTKDVPPDVLAVGMPARFREKKAPEKEHGASTETPPASN